MLGKKKNEGNEFYLRRQESQREKERKNYSFLNQGIGAGSLSQWEVSEVTFAANQGDDSGDRTQVESFPLTKLLISSTLDQKP